MKKLIFLVVILNLFLITTGSAQEIFKEEKYGFSIEKPSDWIEAANMDLLDNLSKFELDDEKLAKFVKDHNGSVLLTSFYKYNPKIHAGLIPTIQVNVRLNGTRNFEEFKNLITQSANSFKQYFDDFKFESEPEVIEIDGVKSVYFVGSFSMETQKGEVMKVRSRTYAIPHGKYFFQLNFTDGKEKENNAELFDRLIQTVRIGDLKS